MKFVKSFPVILVVSGTKLRLEEVTERDLIANLNNVLSDPVRAFTERFSFSSFRIRLFNPNKKRFTPTRRRKSR